jgi:hypothetical protein
MRETMTNKNEKVFVKITNNDIYNKLEQLIIDNTRQHNEIINHQLETNGKVKLNRWMATTAIVMILTVIGWIISGV